MKFHPNNKVTVTGAPGFEDFEGWRIPGLEFEAVDGRGNLCVVTDADSGIHVIPVKYVEYVTPPESPQAKAYRREWATLTGKPEREIYVPEALR